MANTPNTGAGIGNQVINDLSTFFYRDATWGTSMSAEIIDDGTDKVAECGTLMWSDGGTHNIAGIGHYYGMNTTGTATFRVSLQDLSTAASPLQPDGTVDQSWTSVTPPTSNAWTETIFSTVRSSVAHGTRLGVVWDFSAFTATSVFRPASWGQAAGVLVRTPTDNVVDYNITSGGAWLLAGGTGRVPSTIFISDDATPVYGTFQGALPWKAVNTHAFNSGSNPKVHALSYTPVRDETLVAVRFPAFIANLTSDYDVVIYSDAGAVLATTSIDVTQWGFGATTRALHRAVFNYGLSRNTNYRIGIRPTTAGNVTMYSYNLDNANYRKALKGGTQLAYTTLSSGDVWAADTTTGILMMELEISADGTAASGGLLRHPGMNGGLPG